MFLCCFLSQDDANIDGRDLMPKDTSLMLSILLLSLLFFLATDTKMSLAFKSIVGLSSRIRAPTSHGFRTLPTVFVNHRQGSRLFSSAGSEEDTVVSRCTEKLTELLNPAKLRVTSSNEDPNGSHVSL